MGKKDRLDKARELLYAQLSDNADYLSTVDQEEVEGMFEDGYYSALEEQQIYINNLLDIIGR